jgi:hypothetical protein
MEVEIKDLIEGSEQRSSGNMLGGLESLFQG